MVNEQQQAPAEGPDDIPPPQDGSPGQPVKDSEKQPSHSRAAEGADQQFTNPGDQARAGTPGTGENICPRCRGSGRVDGAACESCGGSGRVIEGIGGA